MKLLTISDNAARQAIDAANLWAEYLHAQSAAQPYGGGMYWKKEGSYEYLVKTLAGNKQQRLGARSSDTEHIYTSFHARKQAIEARLASLAAALGEAQRLNKAVRVGRTPDMVVKILNALREAGMERHFRVVGTHALYAYESCAGVRIDLGTLATQDVDVFGDAKRKVEFLVDLPGDVGAVLAVLQRVDASFRQKDDALKCERVITGRASGARQNSGNM